MTMIEDQSPLMVRCDVWLSGVYINTGAAGMQPVRNQAMDGLFTNFVPKAGHHNMFAPS